jgi:hypothetical protein
MNLLYAYAIDGRWGGGEIYLASLNPARATRDAFQNNPQRNKRYFQKGKDELFASGPTWFATYDKALAAAEAMGFIVVGPVTPYSALPEN